MFVKIRKSTLKYCVLDFDNYIYLYQKSYQLKAEIKTSVYSVRETNDFIKTPINFLEVLFDFYRDSSN